MSAPAHRDRPRSGVVDLGSNSVRLVVFEGRTRNPLPIFNEKAVLKLGRGLQSTGRLNEQATARALLVLRRFHLIARAMGAEPFEVLATAAVREAQNGEAFIAAVRKHLPAVPVRIMSSDEEAALSARGLLCGIPDADGLLAGIGGGSLELVQLAGGLSGQSATLSIGVLRLADRAGGDPDRARGIVDTELAAAPWLGEAEGRNLYLIGGAWRALARIHIAQTGYPLTLVHHYAIRRDEARSLAELLAGSSRRALERLPGVTRRRLEDLPFAAVVLGRLLRAGGAGRVVFSANGWREAWYLQLLPAEIAAEDPLLAAGRDYADRLGRDSALPPALIAWTRPLFPDETPEERRLREAACWMSDIGSRDHPEYRAEQAFLRVLRQPGVGLDHPARAFLALTVARRYDAPADAPWVAVARELLDATLVRRADVLGSALRLAYTLCAGTPDLLARTALRLEREQLALELDEGAGVFAGDSVERRLDRLGDAMGLRTAIAPLRALPASLSPG